MIVCIFFFSGLCAVYLMKYNAETYHELSLIAVVYHLTVLAMIFISVRGIETHRNHSLEQTSDTIIYPLTYFIVTISLIHIFTNIQDVSLDVIQDDVVGLRRSLREERGNSNIFIRYVDDYAKKLSIVPLVLTFYFMKFHPQKKTLIFVLLFCSMGHAFVSLKFAGREYIIKYLFVLTCVWHMMKNNLTTSWSKFMKWFFIMVTILSISIFIFISVLRFDDGVSGSTQDALVSYLGQGLLVFSDVFEEFPSGIFDKHGTMYFSFFAGSASSVYNLNDLVYTSVSLNAFPTIIGSWIQDCGILWTTVIVAIFSYIISLVKRLTYYNVFILIYIAFICEFLFSLPFFFSDAFTGSRVFSLLFIIVLDNYSRKKTII